MVSILCPSLKVEVSHSVSRTKSESGGTHNFNGFFSCLNLNNPPRHIKINTVQHIIHLCGLLAICNPRLKNRCIN